MSLAEDIRRMGERVLAGGQITEAEAYSLAAAGDDPEARRALRDTAAEVTSRLMPHTFDLCSIVNARSGSCSEDCKWCAQSRHYDTGCATYPMVDTEECLQAAAMNRSLGIRRFSMVASGRRVTGKPLQAMCDVLREVKKTGLLTCASMGLLGRDELQRLKDAGVTRYHCNLESAPSHFGTLCTTHTIDDKLRTIELAHELGMDVCSGGIIGMGETARQRVEFALTLRRARPVSIPINVLCPIPGTPLAEMEPISPDEIIDTVAMMRMVHPAAQLRFAGGRARLSREHQLEAIRVGVTSAIAGDMLTTVGSTVESDKEMIAEAGLELIER